MAQQSLQIDSTDKNIQRVNSLVSFLEFTLNTMGNPQTTAAEKDVIITQSYLKLFRDPEVQVEDDLDQDRQVVTNKDVQAYLKDVDFFFKTAHFTFEVADIETLINDREDKVYLVKINRNLLAVTIDDDSINSNLVRFLEVNHNIESNDLKIASYYTTKLSEEEDLFNWWNQMSFEWRMFFLNKFNLKDSVGVNEIRRFRDVDSIDIAENPYITDLDPLAKCDKLKFLNANNTFISSLGPLRYLSKLQSVNISNTSIPEIKHLHYSQNLRELDISFTPVTDYENFRDFKSLRSINLSGTMLTDLTALASLQSLTTVNLTGTLIESLEQLASLTNLEYLDLTKTAVESLEPLRACARLKEIIIENTVADDLSPLADAGMLKTVNCESTNIGDLTPLLTCPSLEKIYCDNSGVTREMSDEFNRQRPEVLIIFESQVLQKWWNSLTASWKDILRGSAGNGSPPGKENLARIINQDSLSIHNRKDLADLNPVSMLRNLRYLDCSHSNISDLSPLEDLENILYLNLNHTPVRDLSRISGMKKLKYLDIGNSQVRDIYPIKDLRGLSVFIAENTAVLEPLIMEFAFKNPETQVIYRTESLSVWWNDLDETWKKILRTITGDTSSGKPDTWQLHRIGRLENLLIDSAMISDLEPLRVMDYLGTLEVRRTSLFDIRAIESLASLKHLAISMAPLVDFSSVGKCFELEELDLSNTGFDDLSEISELFDLRRLNLSGTRIKSLSDVDDFEKLAELNISNSKVKNLKPIFRLNGLKLLICYNTRITGKMLENFRMMQPSTEIVYY